jgi:hypothetical protein
MRGGRAASMRPGDMEALFEAGTGGILDAPGIADAGGPARCKPPRRRL